MKTTIIKLLAVAFVLSMVAGMATNMALATKEEKSPYKSGYDHGCDDAFIFEADERYINQKGKGPSFHTESFMEGYNAGFKDCSNEESQEENSWVTNQAQQQTQTIRCGNIIVLATVTCSNSAGQGQQSSQ